MRNIYLRRILIATFLMLLTIFVTSGLTNFKDMKPFRPLSQFPLKIGPWRGTEDHFDQRVYDLLGVDDSFLGNYRNPEGVRIQLYVGFYSNQREGDLIHSPRNCMPGSGWDILQVSTEQLTIYDTHTKKKRKIRVAKLLLEKGNQRELVLYWFQSRGRFISSEYMQKIYLITDSILKHRTDGTFVRIIAPFIDNNEEKTLKYLKDFATITIPVLGQFIPS